MTINPTITPYEHNFPLPWLLDSGIISDTTTQIMAPAAKLKATDSTCSATLTNTTPEMFNISILV